MYPPPRLAMYDCDSFYRQKVGKEMNERVPGFYTKLFEINIYKKK